MPTRSQALADKFKQAVAEFANTVDQIPDGKWNGGPEGWTIAGVALGIS